MSAFDAFADISTKSLAGLPRRLRPGRVNVRGRMKRFEEVEVRSGHAEWLGARSRHVAKLHPAGGLFDKRSPHICTSTNGGLRW
jgi:hypothetical protein